MLNRVFRTFGGCAVVGLMMMIVGCGAMKMGSAEGQSADVKTMNARLEGVIEWKKERVNVRLNVRMVADSMIWISAQPFVGMEVVRVALMPDSVRIINRLSRTYAVAGWNQVAERWQGASYSAVERGLVSYIVRAKEGQPRRFALPGFTVRAKVTEKGVNQRSGMTFSIPTDCARVSIDELLNDIV